MSNSHYKSSLRSFDGTQVITGFDRIATIAKVVATDIEAGNYIKVGTKYVLTTSYSTAASINAEATLAVGGGTVPKGSIVLGNGEFWLYTSDNVASMIAQP